MKQINMLLFTLLACALAHGQKIDWEGVPLEVKEPVQFLDANDEESDALYIGRCTHLKWNRHDQHLYVSDGVNHQIHLYDSDLKYVKSIGRMGQGPSEFGSPVGRGFNSKNELTVYEVDNSRLQIIDAEGQCVQMIPVPRVPGIAPFALVDCQDRIYINCPAKGQLFSVFNRAGECLGGFGERVSVKGLPPKDLIANAVDFAIDSSGIYCVFSEVPLLRKYDLHWQVLYELDLSGCPEVKNRQEFVRLEQLETDRMYGQGGICIHSFTFGVSLDRQFFYFNLYTSPLKNEDVQSVIYAANKTTGEIVKKIQLKTPGSPYQAMSKYPDLSDQKYIFALHIDQSSLYKYDK